MHRELRAGRAVDVAAWAAAVVLLLVYAWWAVSRPPFSAVAALAVLAPAGMAVLLGTRRRRPPQARDKPTGVGWWVAMAATTLCWELAAYLQHPRADHPTLSSLTDALLNTHPIRAAAFALWLLATVELARR